MGIENITTVPHWLAVVYFSGVIALVAGMVGVSFVLGERHKEKATEEPYESGVVSVGSARVRFSAKFYLIAMFLL